MTFKKTSLSAKMMTYKYALEDLLKEINLIEQDNVMESNEKLSKIKTIRMEINKIAKQIDIAKKEIILINSYDIN